MLGSTQPGLSLGYSRVWDRVEWVVGWLGALGVSEMGKQKPLALVAGSRARKNGYGYE